MSKTVIGIDLGTTNCTLASASSGEIAQFSIPQMVAAQTLGDSFSLPSFVYFPLPEEVQSGVVGLSNCVTGTFARDRGGEIPARLIASAKSWLCHPGIDRRAKHLPLQPEESGTRLSPLEATAELLLHLHNAWDQAHPEALLKEQQVLITVPASFDPSARQLVQEAAILADYPEVLLLEEPQAAFYAWLGTHAEEWRKLLKVGDTILVVDIGGGTTDFSLISVDDAGGDLALKRIAVGAHLLLGGDNIDLSLAYLAKAKLESQGHTLDDWQMQTLVHSCRKAKETLLGEGKQESVDIVVTGRGSRLIGGSLSTTLTREEVEKYVVEAFIPLLSSSERSTAEKRGGIHQIGLPYAQDARISCQLAKFLAGATEHFVIPTAVLFNGGTLKAARLRERLLAVLNKWAKEHNAEPVKELPGADLDFAVSRGAVFYGQALQGKGVRIRSGTSHSYYIGVEESVPAIPGLETPLKAICVVPHGMEEGTEETLHAQEFTLLLGEQATFRFFSHASPTLPGGTTPVLGTAVKSWKQDLTELHSLDAVLNAEGGEGKTVQVKLKSKVTELGVLELWCESNDSRKWKLEFDLR